MAPAARLVSLLVLARRAARPAAASDAAVLTDAEFRPFALNWSDHKSFRKAKYLNDWCSVLPSLNASNGLIRILEGYVMSVVIFNDPSDGYVHFDPKTNVLSGGFVPEVLEEVSRRSGILWRDSTAVVHSPNTSVPGHTYTDWLRWATTHYDLAAGIFSGTAERREMGLRFGFGFTDSSPVLVGLVKKERPSLIKELLSWTAPFTRDVWVLMAGCFVVTAAIFYMLDVNHPNSELGCEEASCTSDFFHTLFLTVSAFTGVGAFEPHSPGAKVLTISWSFAVLLVVAAYTANLASFLIVKDSTSAEISDIADAVNKRVPICVLQGGAYDTFLRTRFPTLPVVHPKPYGYDRVREGLCAAMVKDQSFFEVQVGQKKFNAQCDLGIIGKPLLRVTSGFTTDGSSRTCQDFLMNVLDAVMQSMYNDGWFEMKRTQLIEKAADMSCPSDDDDDGNDASNPMTWQQMSGIFTMHFVTMVVLLIVHFASHLRRHREHAVPPSPRESAGTMQLVEKPSGGSDSTVEFLSRL